MFKYIALIALVLVASSVFAIEVVPKLHHANKLGADKKISIIGYNEANCGGTGQPLVEFIEGQCHLSHSIADHSEIMMCGMKREREEVTIRVHDNSKKDGCNGDVIQSMPFALNQCRQDVFPVGDWMTIRDNGGNLTMMRDCAFGCTDCQVLIPLDKCVVPRHERFAHVAFSNTDIRKTSSAEISVDAFLDFRCTAEPDWKGSVVEGACYTFCDPKDEKRCRYIRHECN